MAKKKQIASLAPTFAKGNHLAQYGKINERYR